MSGSTTAVRWAQQSSAIRLFDIDPDLARFLSPEEHRAAATLVVPVRTVHCNDVDVRALVTEANAFGAVVLEGMLVHHVRVSGRRALRLLGFGDMFCVGGDPGTILLSESGYISSEMTSIALLDTNIMQAVQRFPRIVQGLLGRMAEQSEREAAHLAISQLPRVEERLMAIMWLLAEKWGYVTPAGTVLPLVLTHETLGGLIGARRPTVTLALRDLSEGGQLLRHDRGWLIVEPLPDGASDTSAQLDGDGHRPQKSPKLDGDGHRPQRPPTVTSRSSAPAVDGASGPDGNGASSPTGA